MSSSPFVEANRCRLLPVNSSEGCGPGSVTHASRLALLDSSLLVNGTSASAIVGFGARSKLCVAIAKLDVMHVSSKASRDIDEGELKDLSPLATTIDDRIAIEVGSGLKNEIQTVTCVKDLVAASDAKGGGLLVRLPVHLNDIDEIVTLPLRKFTEKHASTFAETAEPAAKRARANFGSSIQWGSDSDRINAWSGLCFLPSNSDLPEYLAVTHEFSQVTNLIDTSSGTTTATLNHAQNITGLSSMDQNSLLVLESGTVTLWDIRARKPQCFPNGTTIMPEKDPYYSVSVNQNNNMFAVVGEARVAKFFDTRTFRTTATLKLPLKHAGTNIKIRGSCSTDATCFVVGRDHEFVGCHVESLRRPRKANPSSSSSSSTNLRYSGITGKRPQSAPESSLIFQNHRLFRSESTWAGLDVSQQGNYFAGITMDGILYSGTYCV